MGRGKRLENNKNQSYTIGNVVREKKKCRAKGEFITGIRKDWSKGIL